jgi:hypothetical protein
LKPKVKSLIQGTERKKNDTQWGRIEDEWSFCGGGWAINAAYGIV